VSLVRARLLLTVSAATAATVLIPAAAQAAAPLQATEIETHCVVQVVERAADGELFTSSPNCFPTVEEAAVAAATPMLRPQSVEMDSKTTAFSTFTLGIHYDGANGTGSSITVVGSSCTGGYWNTPGWFDNRITSSYNGCYRLRHYDRPGKRGSSTNTTGVGDTDNLAGWMNNRTESVAYFSF